ncbi:helix-turn-helix domain-containing protein [Streptomyces sp. NPDC050856]|uniref:helix-turn-helix domain-containing protein n=1 Tax=Streptomyces sp. NPDC050856 TaxID=3154939 RepID=UPI0033CEF1BC
MSQRTPVRPAPPLPSPKERRRLREARSMSEDQLAEALGVTRATVRSWESGRTTPRGRKREAYARLLTPAGREPADREADRSGVGGVEGPDSGAPGATSAPRSRRGWPGLSEPRPSPVSRPAPGWSQGVSDEAAQEPPPAPAPDAPPYGRTGAGPRGPRRTRARRSPQRTRGQHPPRRTPPQRGLPRAHTPIGVAEAAGGPATPVEAFDALYTYAAPVLVQQAYLLTGRRRLAREAVEYAFHLAWQRWPQVAVDRDPAGWVRAAVHEYALSPWHRMRRAHRHPDGSSTDRAAQTLRDAVLDLPPVYRRTLVLYDGLGLDLPDTAAETEASTPATASRLLHAREALIERLPDLSGPEELQERLAALLAGGPPLVLAPPGTVRTGCERRAGLRTRAAVALTALIVTSTAFTLATAPTRYEPPLAPGQAVAGVPVLSGPERLTPQDEALRERLRAEPVTGPGRLVPDSR